MGYFRRVNVCVILAVSCGNRVRLRLRSNYQVLNHPNTVRWPTPVTEGNGRQIVLALGELLQGFQDFKGNYIRE